MESFVSYESSQSIQNEDRAVGTRIAGTMARAHGDKGYSAQGGEIKLNYNGSAGQSFGAFCIPGLHLNLEG